MSAPNSRPKRNHINQKDPERGEERQTVETKGNKAAYSETSCDRTTLNEAFQRPRRP